MSRRSRSASAAVRSCREACIKRNVHGEPHKRAGSFTWRCNGYAQCCVHTVLCHGVARMSRHAGITEPQVFAAYLLVRTSRMASSKSRACLPSWSACLVCKHARTASRPGLGPMVRTVGQASSAANEGSATVISYVCTATGPMHNQADCRRRRDVTPGSQPAPSQLDLQFLNCSMLKQWRVHAWADERCRKNQRFWTRWRRGLHPNVFQSVSVHPQLP
jgi:hypothetical protein